MRKETPGLKLAQVRWLDAGSMFPEVACACVAVLTQEVYPGIAVSVQCCVYWSILTASLTCAVFAALSPDSPFVLSSMQIKERVFAAWQKSPENPMNQE